MPNAGVWTKFPSEQVKMVHSFVYDGDQNKDFIRALGVRFDVPMREALNFLYHTLLFLIKSFCLLHKNSTAFLTCKHTFATM